MAASTSEQSMSDWEAIWVMSTLLSNIIKREFSVVEAFV